MMQLTQSAKVVLSKRYLKKDPVDNTTIIETPEELFRRVSDFVAQADARSAEGVSQQYFEMMTRFDFLPNSPTLMNAGKVEEPILAACFVLPIEDDMSSLAGSSPSIMLSMDSSK